MLITRKNQQLERWLCVCVIPQSFHIIHNLIEFPIENHKEKLFSYNF